MKKILKALMCLMMVVGIAGCGGKDSTEKQEAVVNQFFEYFKEGDVEKISSICTTTNTDVKDILSITDQMSAFQDTDTYGQTFVDEANSFVKEVFSSMLVSYEIEEVKKDGDDYTVKVSATVKNYSNINFTNINTTSIINNYKKDHTAEIQEIVKKSGQKEALKQIYSDLSTQIFGLMKDKLKEVKETKETMIFTLTPDGDNWLISGFKEYALK